MIQQLQYVPIGTLIVNMEEVLYIERIQKDGLEIHFKNKDVTRVFNLSEKEMQGIYNPIVYAEKNYWGGGPC